MAAGGPPEVLRQKTLISELLTDQLIKGETWYLIDSRWFKQWKKYVGFDTWELYGVGDDSTNPGPIDNSPLLETEENDRLKPHLIDELDYVLLPGKGWQKLMAWFGLVEGQEPIARKVIEHGMFIKHCKVEVYLMELKLCQNENLDKWVTREFSKADTIEFIEKEMRKVFGIKDGTETRVWNKYMSNTYEELNKKDSTVQDVGLYQGQVLVIEQQNEDGTWPRGTKNAATASFSNSVGSSMGSSTAVGGASSVPSGSSPPSNNISDNNIYSASVSTRSATASGYGGANYSSYSSGGFGDHYGVSGRGMTSLPGLCGLSNLGNTCFMNSALQCMSNVPALTNYFLSNAYVNEINNENPLGMKGEIAKSYAELIKSMWSGRHSYVIPRNFKMQVGRFSAQFSGYQQQDSQELLAFLIDGLHEDLNRIRQKPYIELTDANGRPDAMVAQEAWANHQRRNNSVVVDLFHGLFKSTLVCPDCDKVSVTFDPFCFLSLPLPMKKDRTIEVFLIKMDSMTRPLQMKVVITKHGIIRDLCNSIFKMTGIVSERLVVTDVYNHRFHKVFSYNENLSSILERDDIFVYEVPINSSDDPDTVILPVYMRERRVRETSNPYSSIATHTLFGQPMLVAVPRKTTTYQGLYEIMLRKLEYCVTLPEDADWSDDDFDNLDDMENGDGDGDGDGPQSLSGRHGMENGDSPQPASKMEMDGSSEAGLDLDPAEAPADQRLDAKNASRSPSDPPADAKGASDDNDGDGDEAAALGAAAAAKPLQPRRKRLFSFTIVNSYGSADIARLLDNDQPVTFNSRTYLAIDWNIKAKKKYFDERKSEEFDVDESMSTRQARKVVHLDDCIELFLNREVLGASDPWYCPACKKHKQASKKLDLWKLPKVLVVHLKRFSYNRYWRDKLDTLVVYPSNLDMTPHVLNTEDGPLHYQLTAVSNHYGGMGGGHYTAYAKNCNTGNWNYFDDSSVSSAEEDQLLKNKAAYVLFYIRKENDSSNCSSSSSKVSSTSVVDPKETTSGAENGIVRNGGDADEYDDDDDMMDTTN